MDKLEVKPFPKTKKKIIEKPEINEECLGCKNHFLLKLMKYVIVKIVNLFSKQDYQVDKKVQKQDKNISKGLPYAKKKKRRIYFSVTEK